MKILIIGFGKIKFMPYMNFYLDNIDTKENDVHLLYWNRDLKEEDTSFLKNVTLHEFCCYQEDDVSKLSKVTSFLKYRKFALKVLKENFDFIYILHSLPGVLIADKVKQSYKNKYIFDYRDSTFEAIPPFKAIVAQLTKNSLATFVSSDAFRVFLPESESHKTFTSHNLLLDSLEHRDEKQKNGIESDKIRVAFWGFIRHEEINLEMIKKLGKDMRFELHYYGREQQIAENLKKYVKDNNIDNVFFHGEYKPQDRYNFVRETDIIHNIYFDNNTMLAMGNKYYDGAIFRIPQVCYPESFMGKTAVEKGIGCMLNPYDNDFADELYTYYNSINTEEFNDKCNKETERFVSEYVAGCELIKNIK